MDGFPITRAALHDALKKLRDRGAERENDHEAAAFFIGGLNVLTALLDPRHAPPSTVSQVRRCRACGCTDDRACPGGCYWVEPDLCSSCAETPEQDVEIAAGGGDAGDAAAAAAPSPVPEAGTPAPPAIDLPAEPGDAADTASGPSAAGAAPDTPAPAADPPPAQAAEDLPAPAPDAAHAPPGDDVPRGGRLAARLTPERAALFPTLWRNPEIKNRQIRDQLNALPGAEIPNDPALYAMAARLGLPKRGDLGAVPLPSLPALPADPTDAAPGPEELQPAEPAPPAPRRAAFRDGSRLPAVDPTKAEVFEAFDGGMTVRDVAADFGLPLATLSNWHAEWKLRARETAS